MTDAFGPTRLFRNRGDGTFEEITASSGIVTEGPTRARPRSRTWTATATSTSSSACTGDYYDQMPDPPFDANDGTPRTISTWNDGHGHFTDATTEWGVAETTRWSLSCLFSDFDGDGRADLIVTNDFGLKNLYRNVDGKRFEDVDEEAGARGPRLRHVGRVGRLRRRRQDRPLHDRHVHAVVLPPRVPVGSRSASRPDLSARRDPWWRRWRSGNSLLLQRPDHTFEDATARSGAAHAGWNWSVDRRGPRRRRLARHLRDQRHVGRRARPRPRARVLVGDARVLGRLRRAEEDVRPEGRGRAGHRARRVLRQPRRRGRRSALRRARLSRRTRPPDERTRAVAFDANGDGALDLYVRSVQAPEALFLGSRRTRKRALPAAPPERHAGVDNRGRSRRVRDGDASRRSRPRAQNAATRAATSRRAARSCTSGSARRPGSRSSSCAGRRAPTQELGAVSR